MTESNVVPEMMVNEFSANMLDDTEKLILLYFGLSTNLLVVTRAI